MDFGTLLLMTTAAGTTMQGISQYQSGRQQKALGEKQAKIARQEGERRREIARESALEKRKEKRALLAKQIVLYAKSGVKAGVGTPLLVRQETERRMEKEAQVIQEQGTYGYEYGKSQAALYRSQGAAAMESGLWSMGSTLATGFSSAAMDYYKYKPPKTLSTAKKTAGWQWKTSPSTYGRHFTF